MARKLIFKYSTIYDKNWCFALNKEYDRKENKNKMEKFIADISKLWDPKENEIFDKISSYTGLSWVNKEIKIYFVSNLVVTGFSDPLTIRYSQDHQNIIKTLIHESVHQILLQNYEILKEVYEKINKKFPKENLKTKVHLIVNAVTEKVFGKLFGEEENKRIREIERTYKGLKRAYDLLDKIEIKENVIEDILRI